MSLELTSIERGRLRTLDRRVVDPFEEVRHEIDRRLRELGINFRCYVVSCRRSELAQARAVRLGYSKTMKSRHRDGLAEDLAFVDLETGRVYWCDPEYLNSVPRLQEAYDLIHQVAEEHGFRPGADWDKYHFEVRRGDELYLEDSSGVRPLL